MLRNLPFEDATAARRFLNRFQTAVGAMKSRGRDQLVNQAWPTDGRERRGTGQADDAAQTPLRAAAPGGEASYLAVHKGLATYLFAITQKK